MFENYGINIAKIFKSAENYKKELKHPYVGSEHLLLAILDNENEVSNKLKSYDLTYNIFKEELIRVVGKSNKDTDFVLYTPLLKRIIEQATNDAIDNNSGSVTEKHLFVAMLEEGEGIAIRIMIGLGIDLDAIYDDMKISLVHKSREKLEIYSIGQVLNKVVDDEEKVIGREEELNLVIETLLRKNKSNPLLIGKAGVGKTAIVEELARRINKGIVPNELLEKTIIMLEMGSLVSGTKYRGEFEERLTKIIKEVKNEKNIILFVDEIHTMINAGGAEGAINASNILKPYLARGEIKCIGATTTDEYYKTIFKDKALDRRFFAIQVEEPNSEKTKDILNGIKNIYEDHHNIKISEENIEDIIKLSNKYLKSKSNPDKSIELLDMICANKKIKGISFEKIDSLNKKLSEVIKEKEKFIYEDDYENASICKKKENELKAKINGLKCVQENVITHEDILEVIAKKTNIPLLEDREKLFKMLKEELHNKILGQDKAINTILKNVWIKLQGNSKPMSILLVGPSGVGKTETVKIIANTIFKNNLIRLDMSEYNLDTSINKLIGVSAGYAGYDESYVFRDVIDNPYSIILVDEVEKAHPRVLNLFLQILDEGFVTDSKGEKIDFSNTMIFMTSNVMNKRNVGFVEQYDDCLNETFSKEFLGRFTDTVVYDVIKNEFLEKYIKENLNSNLKSHEDLIKEANCDLYGFRNLKHLIDKYNCELDIEIPL